MKGFGFLKVKLFKNKKIAEVTSDSAVVFSPAQLEQIQLGRDDGLSERQIQHYSKPDIHAMDMWDIREKLIYFLDVPYLLEKYCPSSSNAAQPRYIGWIATMGVWEAFVGILLVPVMNLLIVNEQGLHLKV